MRRKPGAAEGPLLLGAELLGELVERGPGIAGVPAIEALGEARIAAGEAVVGVAAMCAGGGMSTAIVLDVLA